MGLSRCKLRDYQQKRLLEYFVLEVTARAAADMLQIHPNSAALFYTKVRILIAQQLALDALQMFDGSIELDESFLVECAKVNAVEALLARGGFWYFKARWACLYPGG